MVDRVNVQAFVYTQNPEFKVLVLKRVLSRGGYYQPVCGGVEQNEIPYETVKREVYEETGIKDIKNMIDLDYTFTYKESKNGVLMNMQDICFACEIDQVMDIALSDEHDAYFWCSINQANELLEWIHNKIALQKLLKILHSY